MLKSNYLIILILSFITINSFSNDPIIVSANRVETPYSQVSSSVVKISEIDIRNSNASEVSELLRSVVGLNISQTGSAGGTTNLFTRGSESNHTLILIDGIEMNDPSNPNRAFNFAHLSLNSIKSIEILMGPQSALYGSNAIGGVINIISKSGSKELEIASGLSYGSFDTISAKLSASHEVGILKYSINTDYLKSEGFSSANVQNGDLDQREKISSSIKFNSNPTSNLTLETAIHYNFDKYDTDNYSSTSYVLNDDINDYASSSEVFYKASAKYIWLDGLIDSTLSFNGSSIYRKDVRIADTNDAKEATDKDRGQTQQYALLNNILLSENQTISLGIDYKIEKDKSRGKSYEKISAYSRSIFIIHNFNYYNFFNSLSARLDSHELFGDELSYRVAPGFYITQTKTKLKSSASTGFMAPTVNQLYNTQSGNKELKPESSFNYELGFEQDISNHIKLGSTFFRNLISNKFGFEKVAAFTYKNTNKGRTEIQGIENFISYSPHKEITFKLNYTKLETRVLDTNLQLLRRPNHTWNASLSYYSSFGLDTTVSFSYVGRRDDGNPFDINFSRTGSKAYKLFNLNMSYKFSQDMKLWVKGNNLFNESYEEVLGYNSADLNITTGLNYNF